jgi:hypothetical protein
MTRYRCLSCLGEYEADQDSAYYHECAPVHNPAWLDPNELGISEVEHQRRSKIDATIERSNKRNENIDKGALEPRSIKREGLGRTKLGA